MKSKYQLKKFKVDSIQSVAHGVYTLKFKHNFQFSAGQIIAIDLVPDGKPRLYSIASGEKEELMEILFDEKKDGKLTPFLSKLSPGDDIYVSEPFGTFKIAPESAYCIAAGTGIAPFVSMARSGLGNNKVIIHGAKMDENFYFSDLLNEIMPEKLIRCCSQQEDTKHYKGRLTQWLMNQNDLASNQDYYLCGSAEMVVQVRDILINKGIPFQKIISETYF